MVKPFRRGLFSRVSVAAAPALPAEQVTPDQTAMVHHVIVFVAGPDEAEGRPVGTVCMAVDVGGDVSSFELRLPGRRQQVREFACITLLNFVRTKLDV